MIADGGVYVGRVVAPSCAERNRRLRIQQRRENWHLADDPPKAESATDADDDAGTDDLDPTTGGGTTDLG